MVMPVVKGNLNKPSAVRLAFHRARTGVPIIEIAYQADLAGVWSQANEVDGLDHLLRGITIHWGSLFGIL